MVARIADALLQRLAPTGVASADFWYWKFCYCVDTVKYSQRCFYDDTVQDERCFGGCKVHPTEFCRKGEA